MALIDLVKFGSHLGLCPLVAVGVASLTVGGCTGRGVPEANPAESVAPVTVEIPVAQEPASPASAPAEARVGAEAAKPQPVVCQSADGLAHLKETEALFAGMDALMASYVDEQCGAKPRKCLTAVAAANDKLAAKIETGLQKAWEAKRSAAIKSLPTEWLWLRVWLDDHPKPIGGLKPPHEPALTKKVREGGKLHPEGDLWCAVLEARVAGKNGALSCETGPGGSKFTVLVAKAAVAKGGALADVQIGDLVKISQHLGIGGMMYGEVRAGWTVYDVPADGVSIAERSTCCGGK